MAALAAAWPVVAAVGTALSAYGNIQQGKAQEQAANAEAAQLAQNAGQVRASAQAKGQEERRQAKYIQSRAQAVAAASGAGTGGTASDVIANIASEGKYRQALALYGGEAQARGLETAADTRRYEGLLARRAGYMNAFTTALGGAASVGMNYAKLNPAKPNLPPYYIRDPRFG